MPKLKLTKTAIAAIKDTPPGKNVYYQDAEVPGLALRARGSSRVYYLVKTDPYTRKQAFTRLGSAEDLDLPSARDLAFQALGESRRVRSNMATGAVTGADLVEMFLRNYAAQNHADEGKRAKDTLDKSFLPHFSTRDVTTIKRKELADIIRQKAVDEGKFRAALHIKQAFTKMFNWALAEEIIDTLPTSKLPTYRSKSKKVVLTETEIRDVWLGSRLLRFPQARAVTQLAILTAQRRGEICGIEWDEIDFERELWTIPGTKTKNGLTHTVPLTPMAIEILQDMERYTGSQSHVFWMNEDRRLRPREDGPMVPDTASRYPRQILSKTLPGRSKPLSKTVQPFTFHDFRRSTATRIAELSESRDVVKHILNHKEPGAITLYDLHTYDGLKRKALLQWEQRLQELLGAVV